LYLNSNIGGNMRMIAAWLALPVAATAWAQAAEKRLNVDDLVQEAMRANPEIRAAQNKYQASRQRPAQERSLPDPMVSFGWNSVNNPLPGGGLGRDPVANIGVMASQGVPYPGKLRLRGDIARKEADAEAQQYRAAALGVISRLKQAFYILQHTYVMGDVLERNRDLLRSLLRATEERYAAGRAAQADVFRAQTQLTLIETRLAQIDRERSARAVEINSLLNRPSNSPLDTPAEPHLETMGFTVAELIEKARDSAPALARDQKMIDRAGSAVNLARKGYYPDLTLNGGFYSMGSMGQMYMFRADLTLPLRLTKTRAEITERSQELAGARHSYEATSRSLESKIQDDYLAAETALRLAYLYRDTVIPQARLTVESSLPAYETGTADFLSVLTNYLAIIEYEMSFHEQSQAYHLALTRLEEITGVELTK
jgi:outer membrane protein TolC